MILFAMTARIDKLFLIFGTPKQLSRETSLSIDKYFQTKYLYKRTQLEYTINTRTMSVMLANEIFFN